jgi:release factor glutamine methyltransferase
MNSKETLIKQKLMLDKIRNMNETEEIIDNIKIIKAKNVFYPHKDTILLAKSIKNYEGKNILEVGTGSGFISIYLADKAKSVDATDINPDATTLAKLNCQINKRKNISIFLTDLFPVGKKYDLIVANLPYTDNEAKDYVERSVWDKNHETLINFLKKVKEFLNPQGEIYLSWAEFADFNLLKELLIRYNFNFEIVDTLSQYKIYRTN